MKILFILLFLGSSLVAETVDLLDALHREVPNVFGKSRMNQVLSGTESVLIAGVTDQESRIQAFYFFPDEGGSTVLISDGELNLIWIPTIFSEKSAKAHFQVNIRNRGFNALVAKWDPSSTVSEVLSQSKLNLPGVPSHEQNVFIARICSQDYGKLGVSDQSSELPHINTVKIDSNENERTVKFEIPIKAENTN